MSPYSIKVRVTDGDVERIIKGTVKVSSLKDALMVASKIAAKNSEGFGPSVTITVRLAQ